MPISLSLHRGRSAATTVSAAAAPTGLIPRVVRSTATRARPNGPAPPAACRLCSRGMSSTAGVAASSSSSSSSAATPSEPVPKSRAAEQAAGTLIVGGGIAGLATAAALRNVAGVPNVRVLEACTAAQFADGKAGAAAQIGPNGLRALRLICGGKGDGDGDGECAVDKLRRRGTELAGSALILPGSGGPGTVRVSPDTARDDTGLPQVLVRWGVLRSTLSDLLPASCVLTGAGSGIAGYRIRRDDGTRCADGGSSGGGLEPIDGSGNRYPLPGAGLPIATPYPPLLVGADGVRSTFRALVRSSTTSLPAAEDADAARGADVRYGGRINVKAVVDRTLGEDFEPGHTYACFAQGGGTSTACFAGPAGQGSTYWAVSLADTVDDETGRTSTFLDDVDTNSLEEKARAKVLARLEGLQSSEVQFAIDLVRATHPSAIRVERSEEMIDVGPSLHSSDGNVVLVGDAAHAVFRSYGQAANFALEDAATLAVCVRDSDDLRAALERYSEGRVERCKELQRRSSERAARAMKGDQAEDVSKWIFEWDIQ